MLDSTKDFLRRTPFIKLFIRAKRMVVSPDTQNDEAEIVKRLVKRFDPPNTFVEFGFSGWEYNCAPLAQTWDGLLIDGDNYNIVISNNINPKNIIAKRVWLTLETLNIIENYSHGRDLGIVSVDVDGNDFWFLKRIIHLRPAIIIAEYNSSFGLRPVTVPYDPAFDRREKHDSRLYYGASLSAFTHLANVNGYALIEVSNSGVNAFFVRRELMSEDDRELKAEHVFREKSFPDGSRPSQQWERIKHLPFIDVTELDEINGAQKE